MNELLLLIILLISITIFIIIINKYDNKNINIYLSIIITLSYILSFRNIKFIGMNINSNIILYSSIIPILYFYLEKNKDINIKELLNRYGILLLINILLIMMTTGYIPSVTDNNAINIQNLFGNNFIKLLSYPITLLITIYLIYILRLKLKDTYPNHFYTITILGSIITTVDIFIYNIITYSLYQPFINILFIITVSYVIRIILIVIYSLIIEKNLPKKKVKK